VSCLAGVPSLQASVGFISLESRHRDIPPDSACSLRHGPKGHYRVAQVRITRAQRNAVAEKITSLERSFYGRGPRNVKVSVSDDDPISLVVVSVDSLTVADAVLSERGHKQAVIRHHEALHEATKAEFLEAIEQIVGSPVSAYLAQVHPNTGYAVRVFVFSDLGDFDEPDQDA
jgi:uncharacterized protein YbcI